MLKNLVRGSQNPIAQVVKRGVELENAGESLKRKQLVTKMSTKNRDSWFLLETGDFVRVEEIKTKIIQYAAVYFNQ